MSEEQGYIPTYAVINRHGNCPVCDPPFSWDGGDILEEIRKIGAFSTKTEPELLEIAANCYGYTPDNKARFTKLASVEIPLHGINVWECPKCYHVWDKVTFKHSANMRALINEITGTEDL